ncbi:hypothetical protein TNCT_173021 [Trichonephila clavata]|uniref:Uncharacterized protein n=1 Tax=Trichonephila clavata TaxID=2740835 RepID=A0A8X6IEJ9_TRICU|nr:hypothetical protein TNCT_173021 [Trichonephila clavata]
MELNLDHYLDSGMEMNLEQPLTPGNDMDITLLCSDTTSRPRTPQPSGCQRRRLATENLKYYAITIVNIKSNINALRINGLTDESSYIWKENLTRLADYTHLQETTPFERRLTKLYYPTAVLPFYQQNRPLKLPWPTALALTDNYVIAPNQPAKCESQHSSRILDLHPSPITAFDFIACTRCSVFTGAISRVNQNDFLL